MSPPTLSFPGCSLCTICPTVPSSRGEEAPTARLTTQWSVEDEEEAARERRRRERDRQLRAQDEDRGGQSPELPEQETLLSLKPSEAPEPDEDEGFSDWSQKPEQRPQDWGAGETSNCGEPPWGESPEGQQEEDRQVGAKVWRQGCQAGASPKPPTCTPPHSCVKPILLKLLASLTEQGRGRGQVGAEASRVDTDKHSRGLGFYGIASFFLPRSHQHACGNQDGDEQSPARVPLEELHLSPSSELQEGLGAEETDPKSPEGTIQGSLGPAEAEEADEQHQKCQQPRTPSPLVLEGSTEQGSPPLSPSTKLVDRTESLNRSIRKSNSVKKSQPALPISKIDERLEQYTQAIETAGRTPKLVRQPSIELPSMAVASTKSRWETGEVQAQSTAKAASCKDIVAGDMSKKSLWEQKGGSKTSSTIKSTPSGKRYKFVATGHGKYEKVLVDEGSVP
ncbi:lymphocyte-specific protein 1 [Canis aureus]